MQYIYHVLYGYYLSVYVHILNACMHVQECMDSLVAAQTNPGGSQMIFRLKVLAIHGKVYIYIMYNT